MRPRPSAWPVVRKRLLLVLFALGTNIGVKRIVQRRLAELPGPDREHQEISMLALHLLQSALVLVNTRMVDRVLTEPDWAERLTEPDLRGLTPLFWSNVAMHGTFGLDLDKRLDYNRGGDPAVSESYAERAGTRGAEE